VERGRGRRPFESQVRLRPRSREELASISAIRGGRQGSRPGAVPCRPMQPEFADAMPISNSRSTKSCRQLRGWPRRDVFRRKAPFNVAHSSPDICTACPCRGLAISLHGDQFHRARCDPAATEARAPVGRSSRGGRGSRYPNARRERWRRFLLRRSALFLDQTRCAGASARRCGGGDRNIDRLHPGSSYARASRSFRSMAVTKPSSHHGAGVSAAPQRRLRRRRPRFVGRIATGLRGGTRPAHATDWRFTSLTTAEADLVPIVRP